MAEPEQSDLTTLTVELLSAFVSNNTIDSGELASLIQTTHSALAGINAPPPIEPPAPEFEPAVSVRKSLGSRDHILSLIDGKPYKTLKRHLSGHGLTPADYRERYKLPADYPMVAPSYSEHRRDVAQRLGLGRKSAKVAEPEAARVAEPTVSVEPPAKPSSEVKMASKAASTPAVAEAAAVTKTPKPATKRAAKAASPAPAVVDTSPAIDGVETGPPPSTVEPTPAKKVAATKPASAKAKPAASAKAKAKPKSPPAKRGRPKIEAVPAPSE